MPSKVSTKGKESMLGRNPANYHVEYLDVAQHWDASSQPYGGGDALITLLSQGWEMNGTIYMEYKWFGGNRRIRVYHCDLYRDDDHMTLPVIHNPYVNRLLRQPQFKIELRETGKLTPHKVV